MATQPSVPPADAVIVIFGAAVRPDGQPSGVLRDRVAAAARFGRKFAAPLFIPTGGRGRHGPSEASVMRRQLLDAGYPDAAILLEDTGQDTLSSVRAVRRLLRDTGVRAPVFAATSGYHLPRCLALLRLAGIAARPCPPPVAPADQPRRWYWRLREIPALPYDAALTLALRFAGRL
jgi:uncharacterized SAM-binding protein YcdF (DUF218 family)